MRYGSIGLAAAVSTILGCAALAAEPDPATVQTPIQGTSVMGDKGRSGPDGWAIAPVSRDTAPSGKAPGETAANGGSAPGARAAIATAPTLPPGQDPGTPAVANASGPGTLDGGANLRRP